jgi:aldehyde dehydrogenase (NAD+)
MAKQQSNYRKLDSTIIYEIIINIGMTEEQIQQAFQSKRLFFDFGNTRKYEFRIEQLKKLKAAIKKYENEILEALQADLHKPQFEAYVSEVGFMYEELDYLISHLRKWMKPEKPATPLSLFPSSSKVYSEPLGVVLIIAPWNYPFQLIMAPLAGAVAAGNCAIVKPSDNTKHTAAIIEKIICDVFLPEYVSVVQGSGAIIGPMLIERFRFNHIFFTGSQVVGKKVMEMASKELVPVTLELGGKSPVIVDADVNIDLAAKRLVWAKYFNAGQTCVCPDYLLVHESIKDAFIERMIFFIHQFFGESPLQSEHLTHIVNEKRFNVLSSYLKDVHIIDGGRTDASSLCIEPTLIDQIPEGHPLLSEEIFGPLLPVITFNKIKDILTIIRKYRYPLACYVFTKSRSTEKFIIDNVEFGGGCVNMALQHLANPKLPFGGIGFSGMGNYHGKYSFDAFSHKKSMLKSRFILDIKLIYPPYNLRKLKIAHFIFN